MGGQDPRILIINALNKHPEGLTIVSLAKVTGLHRHTSSKYLHELIGAGLVYQRKVGPARLCYLKKKIDRKGIKKLEKKWKVGKKSQVKLITLVLLLSLILISSVAIASNFSNVTSNLSSFGVLPNFSLNKTSIFVENQTIENYPNDTIGIGFSQNETNQTVGNETINETPENESLEIPINEIPVPEIPERKPSISIELNYPKKVNRGEKFEIVASIKNSGSSSAKNLKIEWVLAENFEIVSEVNECNNLNPNSSCEDRITVLSNLSCKLGKNNLKVRVTYET